MTTKAEFEHAYAERSRVTVEQLHAHGYFAYKSLFCDYAECEGWHMGTLSTYEDEQKLANVITDVHLNTEIRDSLLSMRPSGEHER